MQRLQKTTVVAILLFATAANAKDHFPWAASYEAARAEASRQNKPLLLHFWSVSCAPCRHVEKYVFSHPGVGKMVAKEFIPVKINTDERPDLARQFRIESIPHDVFMTADGRELRRASSPSNQRAYLQLVQRVAKNAEETAQGTLSQLSKVAREQSGPRYDPKTGKFQNAPAYYPSPDRGNSVTTAAANQPIIPPPGSQGTGYQGSGYQGASYQAPGYQGSGYQGSARQNPAYPAQGPAGSNFQNAPAQSPTGSSRVVYNPQYNAPTGPPSGSANRYPLGNGPVNNPHVQAPPANGQLFGAPNGTSGAAPPNSPPANAPTNNLPPPGSQPPPWQQSQQRAQSPQPSQGNPPLGMDGYCPVTLLEARDARQAWQKGNPRWGAIHRGRLYFFMGQQQRDRFMKSPDYYAPVLSCNDPVRFIDGGQLVEGKRQHGLLFRKQVFLFADEGSLQKFWQNPTRYTSAVQQAMQNGNRGTVQR